MTAPRRRIIRAPVSTPRNNPRRQLLLKVRARLEEKPAALARWQKWLRRAFNAVEKAQRTSARLERRFTAAEE